MAHSQSQIFISYSHQDNTVAHKVYDRLLSDSYWIWMDERLKPAEKWEPQIEGGLRNSEIFMALLSSWSVDSDWVRHEGSMAYALNLRPVYVQLEPFGKDTYEKLPIWAKPIQVLRLFDGSTDYEDKFQELKQLLGTPLPIRQHLLEILPHYEHSGVLLEQAALALVYKHYDELHLPKDKQALADKLIRESALKLDRYWVRLDKLQNDYEKSEREKDGLRKKMEKMRTDHLIDIVAYAVLAIILFSFVTYLILSLKGII